MFPAKPEFFVTIKSVAQTILTVKYTSFLKEKKTSSTRILYNIKKNNCNTVDTAEKHKSFLKEKKTSVTRENDE